MPQTSPQAPDTLVESSAPQHRRCRGRALRTFLSAAFAALFTLIICHFVTHPPSFLLTEEQRFVKFTEDVFRNELAGNTLSLHYTVANPASYGLEDSGVSIGSASTEARKDACAALENYRMALLEFDYDKLSDQRQLTWEVFLNYLDTELEAADLLLYEEPLGATSGVQAQLPILMAEYTFRTKGDIEDYLTLLSQIPDYFNSILSFEQDKSRAGLFMSSDCALEVISQCLDFAAGAKNHYLIETFDEKIDVISNLTTDEKIAYKARNQSILTGCVFPAYQALAEGLAELEGSGTNEMGLYYYPEGQEYYEYLVKSTVGDSRSIEEIEEAVKTQIVADYAALQELLGSQSEEDSQASEDNEISGTGTAAAESVSTLISAFAAAGTPPVANSTSAADDTASTADTSTDDPTAMLDDLRQKITTDFPLLPSVACEVKYVHESLQDYLSPAFYLTPAIDDYSDNIIYINPASDYSGLELYTTLAHEGYPGHLYQSVYFASQSPDLLRSILDIGGYTEGWATYVELYSYSLYGDDSVYSSVSRLNRSFTLGLASLLDIGIHYRGYTPDEVTAFLTRLGFTGSTAESLYQAILESPANYLQYYVGYLNFQSLRDALEAAVQDFSLKEFHQAVLETGPVPFDLLEKQCTAKLAGGN